MLSGQHYLPSKQEPNSTGVTDTTRQHQEREAELKVEQQKILVQAAEAERMRMQSYNLPHRCYPPMMSHDGLEWVAVAEFHNGSKLVGRGQCPQDALIDYSNQWLGLNSEEFE